MNKTRQTSPFSVWPQILLFRMPHDNSIVRMAIMVEDLGGFPQLRRKSAAI
jgi:hypothetical protein